MSYTLGIPNNIALNQALYLSINVAQVVKNAISIVIQSIIQEVSTKLMLS